jgi:LemA protein
MKKLGLIFGVGFFGLLLLIGSWWISTQNRFVRLNEAVQEKWAQVENVYQRRADLIPNLVNTVKGYAKHEQETLNAVIEARSKIGKVEFNSPGALQVFQKSQDQLSSALSRLMAVIERYPDLKANQNFLELQAQLEGTENRIAVERNQFNRAVQEFNSAIQVFPASIVARFKGLSPKDYFKASEGSNVAPRVEF